MRTTLLLVFLVSLASVLGRPQTFRNSCPDQVNHLRQEYAQKYNVANLNQLVYDKNLDKNIMKSLEDYGSCEQKENVENGITVMTGVSKSDELFNSDSSKMACFKSKCVETGEDVYSFAVDEGSSLMIYGSPGTRCSPDHPTSDNGLCASGKTLRRKNIGGKRQKFFDFDILTPDIPGFPGIPKPKCILDDCDRWLPPPFPEEEMPGWLGDIGILNLPRICTLVCFIGPCPC